MRGMAKTDRGDSIVLFLRCPDVDPMHSQKLDTVFAVSGSYLNNLAGQLAKS